jgi:hypothetical protein
MDAADGTIFGVAHETDGVTAPAELEVLLIEQQLEVMERSVSGQKWRWPWLLVIAGVVVVVGLGVHAYTALGTIDRISTSSKIATPNALVLFQDVATNGPRVPPNVESSSRNAYSRALTQFVLDGTGVCLGISMAMGGLFVRVNERRSRLVWQ